MKNNDERDKAIAELNTTIFGKYGDNGLNGNLKSTNKKIEAIEEKMDLRIEKVETEMSTMKVSIATIEKDVKSIKFWTRAIAVIFITQIATLLFVLLQHGLKF